MANALVAIKTERVTDTVYQLLRERITDGVFLPGSKINVDEIARQLNVSRTPVHEALNSLAVDGLVEVKPRRGTFVTEFTLKDYEETLAIRRSLELLASETFVDLATERDINDLEGLIDKMEVAVKRAGSAAEAARVHDSINLDFHLRLVNLSDNQRLIHMYADLRAHLKIARAHVDATGWQERVPTETQEHAAILAALRRRDPELVRAALDHHLRRSARSLIEDVQRNEGRNSDRLA